MAIDRSIRSLTALTGASTSRVLNLASIALANLDNAEHRRAPFFTSPVMNTAILLKHRVRSDETYLFAGLRPVATKIIVPFNIKDLKAGGRSFFVEQRGYAESLREIGNYSSRPMESDLAVLRVVDALPSLDPFLLREHLRGHGFECADCYFAIAEADRLQMHDFVAAEIRKLIQFATGDESGSRASTLRLAEALLSSEIDEKLEPLRQALVMETDDFREGVFSWRGFLYYKWCMARFWPEVIAVLRAMRALKATGARDSEGMAFLQGSRQSIIEKVREAGQSVQKILQVYDAAYDALFRNDETQTFRDFLLSAPHLFIDLGEKMGVISHIVSFWNFRFPDKTSLAVDAEELSVIFQDFNSGFLPAQQIVFT